MAIISRFIVDATNGLCIITGEGAPGSTDAPKGSMWLNRTGGSNTTIYAKTGSAVIDWQILTSGSAGGAIGVTGATGVQGATGIQGATGVAGTNGTNGTNGAVGPTGPTGPTGPAGSAGAVGTTGATGIQGATGPNYAVTVSTSSPSGTGTTNQLWLRYS